MYHLILSQISVLKSLPEGLVGCRCRLYFVIFLFLMFSFRGYLLPIFSTIREEKLCLRAPSGSMLLIIGLNVLLAASPGFCESCLSTVWPLSLGAVSRTDTVMKPQSIWTPVLTETCLHKQAGRWMRGDLEVKGVNYAFCWCPALWNGINIRCLTTAESAGGKAAVGQTVYNDLCSLARKCRLLKCICLFGLLLKAAATLCTQTPERT